MPFNTCAIALAQRCKKLSSPLLGDHQRRFALVTLISVSLESLGIFPWDFFKFDPLKEQYYYGTFVLEQRWAGSSSMSRLPRALQQPSHTLLAILTATSLASSPQQLNWGKSCWLVQSSPSSYHHITNVHYIWTRTRMDNNDMSLDTRKSWCFCFLETFTWDPRATWGMSLKNASFYDKSE